MIFPSLVIFIFFGLKRVFSLLYIGLSDEVYSSNLEVYLFDGFGSIAVFWLAFLVFTYLFESRLALPFRYGVWFQSATPGYAVVFPLFLIVCFVFFEMLGSGVIPLLDGVDRLEYSGAINDHIEKYAFLVIFLLIAAYDLRCSKAALFILLLFVAYFVLTGHRFSIFFLLLFVFVFYLSVGLIGKIEGALIVKLKNLSFFSVLLAVIFFCSVVSYLVYHSYFNVRSYEDPSSNLYERILVQPGEVYSALSNDFVFFPSENIYENFVTITSLNEFGKNSNMEFLMSYLLGEERSHFLLGHGEQFAGGFPEGAFLSFGLAASFFVIFCVYLLFRFYVFALEISLKRGSVFFSGFVFYSMWPVLLFFISGFFDWLFYWLFWVKFLIIFLVTLYSVKVVVSEQ